MKNKFKNKKKREVQFFKIENFKIHKKGFSLFQKQKTLEVQISIMDRFNIYTKLGFFSLLNEIK